VARYNKTSQFLFPRKRKSKRSAAKRVRRRTANQPTAMRARTQPSNGTCCVDVDAMRIICTDPTDPRHNEVVLDLGVEDAMGIPVTTATGSYQLHRCTTTTDCCYDAHEGVVVCKNPDDALHGKKADVVEDAGNGFVYVCFQVGDKGARKVPCFDPDQNLIVGGKFDGQTPPAAVLYSEDGTMVTIIGLDPAGGAPDVMMPVCPPGEVCLRLPLCAEPPQVDCCYDAVNGVLQCSIPDLNGQVPELISEGTDEEGNPYVVVQHPGLNDGARARLPLCPETPPPECCYDVATGKLRCPGNPEFDGLDVELQVAITEDMVSVAHPLLPGGAYDFPICIDETPPECCYDGEREILVCPGDLELDGKPATVLAQFEVPDGSTWVTVTWEGGGGDMRLCTEECPPSFCCINVNTMRYVCFGSDLNGQLADVQDIVTIDGFDFAVLTDGMRIPICGRDCPPPPECPPEEPCPPGMWRDPDGVCREPPVCPPPGDCPPCPPGETCPPCPPCPPGEACPPQVPCPPQERCPPGVTPPPGMPPVTPPPRMPPQDCRPCAFPLTWGMTNQKSKKRPGNPHGEACCESCAHGGTCEGDTKANPAHRRRHRRRPLRYRQTRKMLRL